MMTAVTLPVVAEVYDVASNSRATGTGYVAIPTPHDAFYFSGLWDHFEHAVLNGKGWGDPGHSGGRVTITGGVGGGAGIIVGPYTAPVGQRIVGATIFGGWHVGFGQPAAWKVLDIPDGPLGADGVNFVAGAEDLEPDFPGPALWYGGPAGDGVSIINSGSDSSLGAFVNALANGQMVAIVTPHGSSPTYLGPNWYRDVRWVVLKVILEEETNLDGDLTGLRVDFSPSFGS